MSTKERRKFMRFHTDLEVEYWAKGIPTASGQAQSRDFSREGLGVVFPQPVPQGEQVDLTLRVPGDNVPIFATGQVAWIRTGERRPGADAGLRLLSIKPLDLARLLDFVYSKWLGGLRENL